MPTYVYECTNCGEFEQQQAISDPAFQRCPNCGAVVRRVIAGGTSFIMKGRGVSAYQCDRSTPCCGRDTRCDQPPCGK